jgi:exosortase/archaeosortase family protein
MLSTPKQRIFQSVLILLCLIIGIIFFFRSFFQIPDLITITVIVAVVYTYSRLVAPIISDTLIPEFLILSISLLIFRVDELILLSSFTELLTNLTSVIIVNILVVWESVFIIASIGIIGFLYKSQRMKHNNKQKYAFLIGISFLFVVNSFLSNITQYSFTVIDSMSLLFYRSQDIVRIDIIQDCSGIYGMMIFTCSFLLFGTDTKRKTEWDNKKMAILFFGGLVGVYLLNILRIFTVINASLFMDLALKSFIHAYLGSILILLFVITYWVLIWSNAFSKEENFHLENDD